MKAEQRHELQKNELADWLGRIVLALKTGSRATYISILVGTLAIFLVLIWWYNSSGSSSGKSTLWTGIGGANDVKELELLAEQNKGTMPARVARFDAARILYQEGLRDLAGSDTRAGAITKLEKVRQQYQSLATDTAKEPLLNQEALLWTALTEETLIGTSSPEKPGEPAGSIAKAPELYQKIVTDHPGTPAAETAAKRLKELQDKRKDVESFYAKMNEEAQKASK